VTASTQIYSLSLHDALPIFKQMASAKAGCVTYFQAVGPHGIISNEGEEYPVLRALRLLREDGDNNAFETHSSQPLMVDGIVFQRSEEHTSELQSRENLVCRL